jgi:hypothetical protein
MPSIAEASLLVTSYPKEFSSPYGNDQLVPLYSSVPLNSPVAGCLPCLVCGTSITRHEIIAEAGNTDSSKAGAKGRNPNGRLAQSYSGGNGGGGGGTGVPVISPPITFSTGNLLFKLPCTGDYGGNLCYTDGQDSSSGAANSNLTGSFSVTFRVRGVIETTPPTAWSNQGNSIQAYVQKNPSGYSSGNNVYSFILGSDTYVINWGIWDGNLSVVDYLFTVTIPVGQTYQLLAQSIDYVQTSNFALLEATDDDASHPILVQQPYNGQFMQMDLHSYTYNG